METQRKAQNISAVSGVMSGVAERLDQAVGYINDTIPEMEDGELKQQLRKLRDQLSNALEIVNESQIKARMIAQMFWDEWKQEPVE